METSRRDLFENMPVPKALATMAIPTIISQIINLIYNMVDAFFIGRTGNSYMMAATTLVLTLTMLNVAFANLFGIGGGSLVARLMGVRKPERARCVSAFSVYGCIVMAFIYSALVWIFMEPILYFLGASADTIGYASEYTFYVIVLGTLPALFSQTLAHLLRNAGFSSKASLGLSIGGVLNMVLDPLFMFVIMPAGMEVTGAAVATLLSNVISSVYLLAVYVRVSRDAQDAASLSIRPQDALRTEKTDVRDLFAVGIPSAILTGLFDMANMVLNMLSAAHSDLVLAAMGIVMKVERVPNAVNVGICQGMMPIVAYNYSSGNRERMHETIRFARRIGLLIAGLSILLLEVFAGPATRLFLSTSAGNAQAAAITVAYAALYLRIRCLASPFQFLNYHSSFCMQAVGNGRLTMLHSIVRQLVFYVPFMFLFDRLFSVAGLTAAFPVGEACGAVFALFLLSKVMR